MNSSVLRTSEHDCLEFKKTAEDLLAMAKAYLWLGKDEQALQCCMQVNEKDRTGNWFDQMTSIYLSRGRFDEATKQAAALQASFNPLYTQDDVWRTMFNCLLDLVPPRCLLVRFVEQLPQSKCSEGSIAKMVESLGTILDQQDIRRALGPEFFKAHPGFQSGANRASSVGPLGE